MTVPRLRKSARFRPKTEEDHAQRDAYIHECVLAGWTDEKIAESLSLSVRTVEKLRLNLNLGKVFTSLRNRHGSPTELEQMLVSDPRLRDAARKRSVTPATLAWQIVRTVVDDDLFKAVFNEKADE